MIVVVNSGIWISAIESGKTPTAALGQVLRPQLKLDGSFGGAERDRTADLLVANEALSQLSYSPTFWKANLV